jgi:heat shock protein HslJ
LLVVACSNEEPTPTIAPQPTEAVATEAVATEAVDTEAVATEVTAPTEAAAVPTEAPPAEATAEPGEQVVLNPDLVAQAALAPSMITLDTQGLPYSWQAVTVPETPYDASQPPGPTGLPAHTQILFGVTEPSQRQPGSPIMYIIPVDAYRAQWDAAGNPSVTEAIDDIFARTVILNVPPLTEGYAALPFDETAGVLDVAVQLDNTGAPLSSATISGYRFVGRWEQSPNPVTNQGLRYVYQGFTNDGRFLVSFFYPVTSPTLPMTAADVPQAEMDQVNSDPTAYMVQKNEELNALTTADWQPDLATLDALVGSLQIEGMPRAGVEGIIWQPVAEEVEGEDIAFQQDTANYTVAYLPASETTGVMRFRADCNSGQMGYELRSGGMVGGYLAQPGPMTLAFCGEESFDQQFVGALSAAQNYRVRPGGTEMELAMPAGGPTYVFRKIGIEAPAPEPTPPPPVVIDTPAPQTPTGVVIAPAGVNVRTGPGSAYPIIGAANYGTEGQIIGRSADGLWWVTPVRSAPNGQGWVSADFILATGAENVPIIPAPPLPATPTPPPPTATPVPQPTPQPVIQFSANPTVINQGECSTLTWNVENIQAVWVYPSGQPYSQFPVTGQGSQQVCPQQTTVYEMRVLLRDNTVQTLPITVQVIIPSNPLANTGWVVTSLYGGATLPDVTPNLFFDDNGRVSAFASCNNVAGPYRVSSELINIGPLSGGLMACADDVNNQESTYLNALHSAVTFEMTLDTLILRDGFGQETARFGRIN